MALYVYNTEIVSVPNGLARTRVLGGNSRRVSINLSSFLGIVVRMAHLGGSTDESIFAFVRPAETVTLAFRDWGPVIQSEIFISHNQGAPQDIIITEVYLQTRCG